MGQLDWKWFKVVGYRAHWNLKCNDMAVYVFAPNAIDALMRYMSMPGVKHDIPAEISPLPSSEVEGLERKIAESGFSLDTIRGSWYPPFWPYEMLSE